MYRQSYLYIMKTNADLSIIIVDKLVKEGLIPEMPKGRLNSVNFQITNAIEDVLDNLLPHLREHR